MPVLYCTYGSNLHPGRLGQRIESARLVGTTVLPGWSLRFHKRSNIDGSAKCDIVSAHDDSVVHAAIFELEQSDLSLLDQFEGVGKGYEHTLIALADYGDVLTYVAQPSHIDDRLRPFEWYKEYVLAGCRYHGFDTGYVDAVGSVPHCDDPDRGRHEGHMKEIEAICNRGLCRE